MRHPVVERVLTGVLLFVPPLLLAALAVTGLSSVVPLLVRVLLWGVVVLLWSTWLIGAVGAFVTDTLPHWRYQRWRERQRAR